MILFSRALCLVLFCFVVATSGMGQAVAQIIPSRVLLYQPLDDTIGAGFLSGGTYIMDFARGYLSRYEDQAWNYRLGAAVDLARFSENSVLTFLVAHEFTANTWNDIAFNPRSGVWEESLTFHQRIGHGVVSLGLSHRCKHDIDNADGPAGDRVELDSVTRRGPILTSAQISYTSPHYGLGQLGSVRPYGRIEYYLYAADSRYPFTDARNHWSDARGSLMIGGVWNKVFNGLVSMHGRGWASAMYLPDPAETRTVQWNARTELALRFNGRVGGLELVTSFEHLFDDVSRPIPANTNTLALALRFQYGTAF